MSAITIRLEGPADGPAVRDVNRQAFGQDQEANIVDALRTNDAVLLSLVAEAAGQVVGHILFSPLVVAGVEGAALGPMAVLPEMQRQGIGTRLVQAGLEQLRRDGCPFVGVVGHPAFYPRVGFRPARSFGISCEWDVPDDVFMVHVLDTTATAGMTGMARYRAEFSTVE